MVCSLLRRYPDDRVVLREVRVAKPRSRSLMQDLAQSHHQKVKVAVTDIDGVMRGKYLHKDKFLSAAEGGGFGF